MVSSELPLARAIGSIGFAKTVTASHEIDMLHLAFLRLAGCIQQRFALGILERLGEFHENDGAIWTLLAKSYIYFASQTAEATMLLRGAKLTNGIIGLNGTETERKELQCIRGR